jgi:GTP cyclohydrolase II
MIDKNKDSKNAPQELTSAVWHLRRGDGIIIKHDNNTQTAVYPVEFLNSATARHYGLTASPTLIRLAKRAGLLPELAIMPISEATSGWPVFSEKTLETALNAAPHIIETARAKLPIENAENSTVASFRILGDETVHLALIIGKAGSDNALPLVRVHSSCVTGDLLGSLRCDCGGQLRLALAAIKSEGYGVLLYLNQEGRGIGISNKLRAYQLQEQGLDTYAANHELGFKDDERDFTVAALILKHLGISKIRLLSNNPHKIKELEKYGVVIEQRVPLIAPASSHSHAYISAKQQKAGHIMGIDFGEND